MLVPPGRRVALLHQSPRMITKLRNPPPLPTHTGPLSPELQLLIATWLAPHGLVQLMGTSKPLRELLSRHDASIWTPLCLGLGPLDAQEVCGATTVIVCLFTRTFAHVRVFCLFVHTHMRTYVYAPVRTCANTWYTCAHTHMVRAPFEVSAGANSIPLDTITMRACNHTHHPHRTRR